MLARDLSGFGSKPDDTDGFKDIAHAKVEEGKQDGSKTTPQVPSNSFCSIPFEVESMTRRSGFGAHEHAIADREKAKRHLYEVTITTKPMFPATIAKLFAIFEDGTTGDLVLPDWKGRASATDWKVHDYRSATWAGLSVTFRESIEEEVPAAVIVPIDPDAVRGWVICEHGEDALRTLSDLDIAILGVLLKFGRARHIGNEGIANALPFKVRDFDLSSALDALAARRFVLRWEHSGRSHWSAATYDTPQPPPVVDAVAGSGITGKGAAPSYGVTGHGPPT